MKLFGAPVNNREAKCLSHCLVLHLKDLSLQYKVYICSLSLGAQVKSTQQAEGPHCAGNVKF